MILATRTSYANQFKEMKEFYDSHEPYNGWDTDCADLFRDFEWMIIGNEEYANSTRLDLYEAAKNDKHLSAFIIDVIQCMRYNASQIED